MTTFEEAKKCPICGQPGEVRRVDKKSRPQAQGGPYELHHVYCVTELCRWKDTPWWVQVNADGSIPEAYSSANQDRIFPKASPETETRVREALEAQLAAETKPGAEVRNPRG